MSYSISQINTWNNCAGKHQLQYVEKLRPATQTNRNLNIGSAVHAGLEGAFLQFYKIQDKRHQIGRDVVDQKIKSAAHKALGAWYKENAPSPTLVIHDPATGDTLVAEDTMTEFQDDFELVEKLVMRTIDNFNVFDNYEIVSIEGKPAIEFMLNTKIFGVDFTGVVDMVVRDVNNGLVSVIDWKTKERFTNDDDFDFDSQMPLYIYALYNYGIVPSFAVTYQIAKKVPRIPNINKNGQLSRDKSTVTDWDTYVQTAVENWDNDPQLNGLGDVNKVVAVNKVYEDMREKLVQHEFFKPVRKLISLKQAELHARNFVRTVNNIETATEFPFAWNSYTCRGCAFRLFCSAILQSSDPEDLIGTHYIKHE